MAETGTGWQAGRVPTYRETAVVLRTQKLGEADRIVTLLTRGRGKVRAVAKGVRRTSSRFGGRLEPFSFVDVQCYEGRNLDTVTQVESLAAYGPQLSGDYVRYSCGQVMLETSDRLTGEEGESSVQQFLLLIGGLRALVGDVHPPGMVLDAFLLRSLSVSGWAPACDVCARCGEPGPHQHFHPGSGGALCVSCRLPGAVTLSSGTLDLMGALLSGDWDSADQSNDRQRNEASTTTTAYLQWHLERGLRSLPFAERTAPIDVRTVDVTSDSGLIFADPGDHPRE